MSEPTYTLEEARRAIALEACTQYGHSWDVIAVRTYADPPGTPVAVQCNRCREYHAVDADTSTAPEPEPEPEE